jgi:hypothetical protein
MDTTAEVPTAVPVLASVFIKIGDDSEFTETEGELGLEPQAVISMKRSSLFRALCESQLFGEFLQNVSLTKVTFYLMRNIAGGTPDDAISSQNAVKLQLDQTIGSLLSQLGFGDQRRLFIRMVFPATQPSNAIAAAAAVTAAIEPAVSASVAAPANVKLPTNVQSSASSGAAKQQQAKKSSASASASKSSAPTSVSVASAAASALSNPPRLKCHRLTSLTSTVTVVFNVYRRTGGRLIFEHKVDCTCRSSEAAKLGARPWAALHLQPSPR